LPSKRIIVYTGADAVHININGGHNINQRVKVWQVRVVLSPWNALCCSNKFAIFYCIN